MAKNVMIMLSLREVIEASGIGALSQGFYSQLLHIYETHDSVEAQVPQHRQLLKSISPPFLSPQARNKKPRDGMKQSLHPTLPPILPPTLSREMYSFDQLLERAPSALASFFSA
jgi:hypothetical protein